MTIQFLALYFSCSLGPVASGKSTLMSMLCALLRGEGKPTFLYDENMLDCVANDQSFDLTELSNEFPA